MIPSLLSSDITMSKREFAQDLEVFLEELLEKNRNKSPREIARVLAEKLVANSPLKTRRF